MDCKLQCQLTVQIHSPFTTQRYTSFPSGTTSSQLEIAYGYNSEARQLITVLGSLTKYTLTNLQFDRQYSILIRARMRYYYYGYCLSYFYGDYSNEVSARTVESGNLRIFIS